MNEITAFHLSSFRFSFREIKRLKFDREESLMKAEKVNELMNGKKTIIISLLFKFIDRVLISLPTV